MLIRKWFGSFSLVTIFNNDFKIYERWQTNLLAYQLKNIKTINDAINCIKRISNEGNDTSDKIMERLIYIYSIYLPSEIDLAKLSLLHQSVIDTYGIEEYAILTIWLSAIQSVIDGESKKITENNDSNINVTDINVTDINVTDINVTDINVTDISNNL